MLRFFHSALCILFAVCCLFACHGVWHGKEIPVPAKAKGLERYGMPGIEASQLNFYLATKKDDVGVFDFYVNKLSEKGWMSCNHKGRWFDYVKYVDDHKQVRIRQNSYYMVLPDKKRLLMMAAQYHIGHSEGKNEKIKKSIFKEYVRIVRYQLGEREYGMAVNEYECMSKNDTYTHGKPGSVHHDLVLASISRRNGGSARSMWVP